tara:strand:- start:3708 stop:3929 length:222 start_codon:yes stop_codon:yes gene_type:complete
MKHQEIQFSSNLRSAIERRNLSQNQLAIEVGMRKSTLHDYLYGVTPRGLRNAVKLATILSLSLDELILGGCHE